MTKPLTFSLSLAIACGLCSVSLAGGHGHAMPSGQGPAPSPQVIPSSQDVGCGEASCMPAPKCSLLSKFHMPKLSCPKLIHTTSYEWVLQKKHHFSLSKGGHGNACSAPACDTCSGSYPSAQGGPSPQGVYAAPQGVYGAPQGVYSAPQAAPAGQAAIIGSGQAAAISAGDPAAVPPTLPREAANAPQQAEAGGLLLLSPSGF